MTRRSEKMAPARIVSTSSAAHYGARLDFDDLQCAKRYSAWKAYNRSKLANILFTRELAKRLAGTNVTANCLHPGVVATNLLPGWLNLLRPLFKRFILTAEQGARTSLYLALDDQAGALQGEYLDEHQQVQPAAPAACDRQLQEQLWAWSARRAGLDQASA